MSYLKCYDTLGEELKYLYQWDINPNVIIKEIELDNDIEVHVCHVDSVNALTVIPSVTDGNIVVSVPSVLLQRAAPIMIYFVRKISEESACTIMVSKITVIPRARPSDYVYTEPEVLTWRILDERLKKIEDGASVEISPEVVEKAITEYLDENPPAPPVKGIDYFTPEEVHDIAEQAAGLVEIPESGGIEVTGAEVGQTIVVKAVDENGVPTEWEPGNAGAKWNLVRHLVVEEAVTSISISSDEAGNPISDKKYSEMYVDYYIPGLGKGNYSSRYGSISFWFNGGWGGGKSVDFSDGGNGYDGIRSAVHAVRPPIQGVGLSIQTPIFYAIMVHTGQIRYTVFDTECLVGVNIKTAAGITAGSVFDVYAR